MQIGGDDVNVGEGDQTNNNENRGQQAKSQEDSVDKYSTFIHPDETKNLDKIELALEKLFEVTVKYL